jgi:hypothetical protein
LSVVCVPGVAIAAPTMVMFWRSSHVFNTHTTFVTFSKYQSQKGLKQRPFSRFLSSLVLLEQRGGKLNQSSLSAVTAAQKLGGPIVGFIAGSNIKPVAEEVAKAKGLEKVIYVENEVYDRV